MITAYTLNMAKRVLSGIRTSGELHLGNYLGALQQFVELQDEYDGYFFLADLHGLTTVQDPAALKRSIRSTANVYLACGLDPQRATFFRQSDIPAHSEMAWLLTTLSTMGEFSRMTQYKDKTQGSEQESIGVGLFTYPALMAGDILLYEPDLVPVGDDQKQHVEITRDLAGRFNHRFGVTLKIPEPLIRSDGARIKGLDDPAKKMSKSASSALNYIAFSDDADTIRDKVKRAVTDSGSEVKAGEDKPALTNLLNIHSLLTGTSVSDLESEFSDKGYGDYKVALAEVIVESLAPIQAKLSEYEADPGEVDKILAAGADKARPVAEVTLAKAKSAMGL